MLDFEIPVLHHAGATIARRKICDSSEAAATASIILRGVEIRGRRECRNPRIQEQRRIEHPVKAGGSSKAICQRLTEIAISKGSVIDAVATAKNRLVQLAKQCFGGIREAKTRSKILVIGCRSGGARPAPAGSGAPENQSARQWNTIEPDGAATWSWTNVGSVRIEYRLCAARFMPGRFNVVAQAKVEGQVPASLEVIRNVDCIIVGHESRLP